jgi:hypothetical protein
VLRLFTRAVALVGAAGVVVVGALTLAPSYTPPARASAALNGIDVPPAIGADATALVRFNLPAAPPRARCVLSLVERSGRGERRTVLDRRRDAAAGQHRHPLSVHDLGFGRVTLTLEDDCAGDGRPTAPVEIARAAVEVPIRYERPPSRWIVPAATESPGIASSIDTTFVTSMPARVTTRLVREGRTVRIWTTVGLRHRVSYEPRPADVPSGTYTLVTQIAESAVETEVHIHHGWRPLGLSADTGVPFTYPRCSTLRWYHDSALMPAGTADPTADLADAFALVAASTGLRFEAVGSADRADIVIAWSDDLEHDGWGGSRHEGSTFQGGSVRLSTRSAWARTPGWSEEEHGRGPLLLHELGHVVGLGHVDDETRVMATVYRRGLTASTWTPAEQEGLRVLYQPERCDPRP